MNSYRNSTVIAINGVVKYISGEDQFLTLADFLRTRVFLTGTKVVCAEGDCGACTVLKSYQRDNGEITFLPINSCITPLFLLDGLSLVTVEGIELEKGLHPVQQAMVQEHGSQCGYCTPGFICAMTALAEKTKAKGCVLTEKRARNGLTGNLCRCTGYKDILTAATSIDLTELPLLAQRYAQSRLMKELSELTVRPLSTSIEGHWISIPHDWVEALKVRAAHPNARVIAGSTDIGVFRNKGRDQSLGGLHLGKIARTRKITNSEENGRSVFIGATVSLDEWENFLQQKWPGLHQLLHVFASPQIKYQGTVCGNVLNGSPIGDLLPFFVNQGAKLVLERWDGVKKQVISRKVTLDNFYQGYRKFDLSPDELALGLECPMPQKNEKIRLYKVSLRKDLDISAVTMAANITVGMSGVVERAGFTYGGVGPVVKKIEALGDFVVGRGFNEETFIEAGVILDQQIQPISDLRASADFRRSVAKNLLVKFYQETQ